VLCRLDKVGRNEGQRDCHHGGDPDPLDEAHLREARDIFIPDLHIDKITVKGRNFR